MTHKLWHITRTEDALTLSRRLPARFDVVAETTLPGGGSLRLAHQIRQDMWRALQNLRGFSPVVEITSGGAGQGLRVRAGGQLLRRPPASAAQAIADVLENPKNRNRWLRHARRSGGESLPFGQNADNAHNFAAQIDKRDESAP